MKEKAPASLKTADLGKYNNRPSHRHHCPGENGEPHVWECSSAYCESTVRLCPDCGGNMPYFDE